MNQVNMNYNDAVLYIGIIKHLAYNNVILYLYQNSIFGRLVKMFDPFDILQCHSKQYH